MTLNDPHFDDEPLMNQVNASLEKGFPLMRFAPQLEKRFLLDAVDMRRQHFLISGLISLLIYNGFLIVDYLMVNDVFEFAVLLRLYLFTPASLVLLYVGTRKDWKLIRSVPPILYEVIVLGSGLLAAVSVALIVAKTNSPLVHFYNVGLCVVVMYGTVVQRLRFWFAVFLSLSILLIHVICILIINHYPDRLMMPITSLLASVTLFSLMANYAMERDERKRFLLRLREHGVVRELTRAHDRLKALSRVDGLTGLSNRRYSLEHLSQVWERAQHDQQQLSMLMVEMDHFKKYSDRYGMQAGDECLRQVAQVLQTHVQRPDDLIARYGGEEFMVILPRADADYAQKIAERIRHAVEQLNLRHESSSTALVATVSIGVASCKADALLKDTALLSSANQALLQAKREGRNRTCSHSIAVAQSVSSSSAAG
ncbi:MAG: GGDEF domain-containing protein [Aquabacterium sp.]|nr:GGDEF domain-containing protein [Aquabacterium sp.]